MSKCLLSWLFTTLRGFGHAIHRETARLDLMRTFPQSPLARFGRLRFPQAPRPIVHVIGRAEITYNGILKGERQLGISETSPIDCTVCILHTAQSIG